MAEFVPGVDLARAYYDEVVRPVLDDAIPDIAHSAGLFGRGSEILGFDTERSMDHSWGPRLLVFLRDSDLAHHGSLLRETLAQRVPETYRDWPTRFREHDDAPVTLRIEVHEPSTWFTTYVGFDPADGLTARDWLSIPAQILRSATAGAVFHDGLDALQPRRAALAWYPHDVWLYVVGCQWARIAQEEPFVGRTGEVGDDLGSRVIAARLARDLMRLCFLLERSYPPYSKWLGFAFERLDCASTVGPHLARALAATSWQHREAEIGAAAECVGEAHNRLRITEPVEATLRNFHTRPFLVLDSHRFATACFDAVSDPVVAAVPRDVGAIDQWVDSTGVLDHYGRPRRVTAWMFER